MMAMFTSIALAEFSIPLNMANSCSVKANDGDTLDRFTGYVITICDNIISLSNGVRRNIKSVGNRSIFLLFFCEA